MKTKNKSKLAVKIAKVVKFPKRFVTRVTRDVNDFNERELFYV